MLHQGCGRIMNNVEPIRNQQKIYAIKQYILGDKYNPAYRERDYLLFVFGINSALRISDLLSLKVKDVLNAQGDIRAISKSGPARLKES